MKVFFTTFLKWLFILSLVYLTITLVWAPFRFFLCSPACAQDKEQIERSLVREVRLEGVKKISRGQIRQQMTGLWPPPFWKFWQEGPIFTPDKLEESLNLVQQLYRQEGYYQTKIRPAVDEKDGTVIITLNIIEGPPVTVERLTFEIRDAGEAQPASVPDEWENSESLGRRFSQMVPLRKWAIFRVKDYEQSKTMILEYLANHGYPRARLFGNVLIYQNENKAAVHLPIDLGPFTGLARSRSWEIKISLWAISCVK